MGERAPVWGLGNPGFHLKDAGECCKACQAHAAVCGQPGNQAKSWWPARPELKCGGNPGCNIWVYCPEEQCFAFDIHVHTKGECWLKQQRSPDGATNLTRPKDPHEGHTDLPAAMRKSPRKVWPWAVDPKIWAGGIPEHVPWISGVPRPPTPSCAARPPTTSGGSGGATSAGQRTAGAENVCLLSLAYVLPTGLPIPQTLSRNTDGSAEYSTGDASGAPDAPRDGGQRQLRRPRRARWCTRRRRGRR